MAEKVIEKKIRICDFSPCDQPAVLTCSVCNRDCCVGHGCVFMFSIRRPKMKKPPRASAPEPSSEWSAPKFEWHEVDRGMAEVCWGCKNGIRAKMPKILKPSGKLARERVVGRSTESEPQEAVKEIP